MALSSDQNGTTGTYTNSVMGRNARVNTFAGSDAMWSLDAVGNWTANAAGAGTGTSTAPTLSSTSRTSNSQNELTAVGAGTPVYDNNGNMITDSAGIDYTFDAWNRMVVSYGGSEQWESRAYDALGRKITTFTSNVSTDESYYSSQGQVLEDHITPSSGGTAQVSQYVWGVDYVNDLILREKQKGKKNKRGHS